MSLSGPRHRDSAAGLPDDGHGDATPTGGVSTGGVSTGGVMMRLRSGLLAGIPTRGPRAGRPEAGFSTSEILVVVAIIGIMVLFTTPALLDFFRAMKVRTAAQRMVSHVRLCRQVAVSRRNVVTMVIEGGAVPPRYRAWEDTNRNNTREPDGADGVADTDDDEPWVVRPVEQLQHDDVDLADIYNDTTPSTDDDVFTTANSVMENDQVMLRFLPDGQVLRVNAAGNVVTTDTLLRIRLDGQIGPNRLDRWYASMNRPGKVQTDFIRNPGWE